MRALPGRSARLAVIAAVVLCLAVAASGQVLKHLPADPWVVVKVGNLEQFSQKLGGMAQKLGLAQLDAAFADPLGALKKQFNVGEGFEGGGEFALAVYAPSAEGDEPRMLALLPVSDFAAFTRGLPNAKTEGQMTVFTLPDEEDTLYAVHWGSYAAISPSKDLLANQPAGLEVSGLAGRQLAGNDLTVFVNVRTLAAIALPQFRQARVNILEVIQNELADEAEAAKFAPVIRSLANQFLNLVEHALQEGQALTFGLNVVPDKGLNFTAVAEFEPNSYLGQTMASIANVEGSMLRGLPDRKYFFCGGMALDPAVTARILEDALGPVRKELQSLEEAKTILGIIDAGQQMFTSIRAMSMGWPAPVAGRQTGLVQQVAVYTGDARKLREAQRAYVQGFAEMPGLMMTAAHGQTQVSVAPDAKTVQGVALDELSVRFKFDDASPEAAQAAQVFQLIFGGTELKQVMGAVDDQTFVVVQGGDEELVAATIAAARSREDALGKQPQLKAVSDQLPGKKAMVLFIAVDQIVNEVLKVAADMGFPLPVKLPDLPPVGLSVGTEGSAMRADVHLSSELISSLVSTAIQTTVRVRQGGAGQQ